MHPPGLPDVRVLSRPSGATSRVVVTVAWPGASRASEVLSRPSNESSESAAGVIQSPHVLSRGNAARSISVTACPRVARCQPADAPAGPAPTIAIRALRAEVTCVRGCIVAAHPTQPTARHALTAREARSTMVRAPRGNSLTAAAQFTNAHEPQAASARPSVPGVSASRNDADARRYLRLTLGHTLAMYGVLAAALFGAMPAWLLLLAVPWLYVRLSLGLHELLHVRAAGEVPAFHRLAMVFDTPFGLGYREH